MFAPGGLLALDLSSVVGWAYGLVDASAPQCGCWQLPGKVIEGARYVALENRLAEAIEDMRPAEMILEASLSLQAMARGSSMKIARQQLTLRGVALMEAYRADIPISEVDSFDVRRDVIGVGRFKKGEAKAEVLRACKLFGWDVPDHNAGDACLTWRWKTARMRGIAPAAGRLFAQVLL